MNRTLKIYIVFLFLLIVGIVYIDAVRPKPINWNPSYVLRDKIPFGLYILDQEIDELLKTKKTKRIDQTLYEYYSNHDVIEAGTLLKIDKEYDIDQESTTLLLQYVSGGNTAFISSFSPSKVLLDTLGIEISSQYEFNEKVLCWVTNKNLGNAKYDIGKGAGSYYFSKIDTLKSTLLGYHQNKKKQLANFVKVAFGKGQIYLHLQPNCFTNYQLLKDNHAEYAEKVLSYIPEGKVFWLTKGQTGVFNSMSPMRFILSQPALKWAWYIFLIGIIAFILFNAKRKQRIVPIKKPLPNTTVDFTKTIGNLYFQEGNHQNLINKKIIYFLEKVRNEYLLDVQKLDENFIKKLHAKTGKDLKDIEHLVYLINYQKTSYHQSIEQDLIDVNNAIEKILN